MSHKYLRYKKDRTSYCGCLEGKEGVFPANRGLFSAVFTELTGAKWTVLSMHFSYQVTDPLCDYAGSLNDSGVTVNECARDSGLKSRSAIMISNHNHAFCKRRLRLWTAVGSKSILTQGRGLFLALITSANTMEKRPLLAGKRVNHFDWA